MADFCLRFDASADQKTWQERLEKDRAECQRKLLKSDLTRYGFSKSLADAVVRQCDMEDIRMEAMTHERIEKTARFLAGAPLHLSGLCPMEKAMAMRGGVSLKEVNPETFESRLVKGLFFAGEMLDLTGPCGGYNIQFAFSSGRLAGLS